MSKKSMQKHNRKGQFVRTFIEDFESEAYRSLDCVARCLLLELQRYYLPGGRMEDVFLSTRDAAKRLSVNKDTAARAFKTLSDRGFIVLTNHARWQARITRKWRLTFEEYGGQKPTHDWRHYKKSRTQVRGQTDPFKGTDGT